MSRRIPWARIAVVLVTAVAILMPLAIVGYQSLLDGPFFQPSARLSLSAFRFVLADPSANYHVPLLLSPYGYTTYRLFLKETDFNRIRAMLDLSNVTLLPMGIAFGVMALTGVIMPFLAGLWDRVYIWLSIVLILFVFVYMSMFNETHYKQLRRLVGLPYMKGNKTLPAEPPSSPEEVAAHLKKTNVAVLTTVGYVIPAIVLWLMIFKPF